MEEEGNALENKAMQSGVALASQTLFLFGSSRNLSSLTGRKIAKRAKRGPAKEAFPRSGDIGIAMSNFRRRI